MVLGLYVIGVWLENRASAKRLDVLRLLLNLPTIWLAVHLGLLLAVWGLLLGYSLLSLMALFWTPRTQTAVAA